jgi:hypothetical protein
MYNCGQLLLTASHGVFLGICLQARDIRRAEAAASSHLGQHRDFNMTDTVMCILIREREGGKYAGLFKSLLILFFVWLYT